MIKKISAGGGESQVDYVAASKEMHYSSSLVKLKLFPFKTQHAKGEGKGNFREP